MRYWQVFNEEFEYFRRAIFHPPEQNWAFDHKRFQRFVKFPDRL
jgi:hypothetical protein